MKGTLLIYWCLSPSRFYTLIPDLVLLLSLVSLSQFMSLSRFYLQFSRPCLCPHPGFTPNVSIPVPVLPPPHVCLCVYVCACVRAFVRACMRVCVRAHVCEGVGACFNAISIITSSQLMITKSRMLLNGVTWIWPLLWRFPRDIVLCLHYGTSTT